MGKKNKSNINWFQPETKSKPEVWDSGRVVLTKIPVYVDSDLLKRLRYIQNQIGNNEFSVLVKSETKDNFILIPDQKPYIPEQEVQTTSVDFKDQTEIEEKRREGYDTVFHSHPFSKGETSFSSADEEHINSYFPVSLLLNGKTEIKDGNFMTKLENGFEVKMKTEVKDYSRFIKDEELELDKIKEKKWTQPKHTKKYYPAMKPTSYGINNRVDKNENVNKEIPYEEYCEFCRSWVDVQFMEYDYLTESRMCCECAEKYAGYAKQRGALK